MLGEDSTHARLQDLLQHYTACPLSPYGETLGRPLARQVGPAPAPTGAARPEPRPRSPRTGLCGQPFRRGACWVGVLRRPAQPQGPEGLRVSGKELGHLFSNPFPVCPEDTPQQCLP